MPKTKPKQLMGQTYHCVYPTPNGLFMPNENPSGKVFCTVISDSNLGKKDFSKVKENVVNSERKTKKWKVKKMDLEKKLLAKTPKEAEMKRSYCKTVCDERANKNEELMKGIAKLEQQNKNILDQLKGAAEENDVLK